MKMVVCKIFFLESHIEARISFTFLKTSYNKFESLIIPSFDLSTYQVRQTLALFCNLITVISG